MHRADELLALLQTTASWGDSVKWRGERKPGYRSVYVGQNTPYWYITYSASLPNYAPFSRADVDELLRRGLLESEYPEYPACIQSYCLVGLPKNPNFKKR